MRGINALKKRALINTVSAGSLTVGSTHLMGLDGFIHPDFMPFPLAVGTARHAEMVKETFGKSRESFGRKDSALNCDMRSSEQCDGEGLVVFGVI